MSGSLRHATLLVQSTLLVAAGPYLGCGQESTMATGGDLTSMAAVERMLEIRGYVYVPDGVPDAWASTKVHQQLKTAIGPLRAAGITVDDRELKNNIDPSTFSVTTLKLVREVNEDLVVDRNVQRVSYSYTARSAVSKHLAAKESITIALLMGDYSKFVNEIMKQCTDDPDTASHYPASFWYFWDSNQEQCRKLIQDEAKAIDDEDVGLGTGQIGERELGRRYLPVTIELTSPGAQPKVTYPEYDRLYGIEDPAKDRVVVYSLLSRHDAENQNDMFFKEFIKQMGVLAQRFPGLKVAPTSEVDPLAVPFKGKTIKVTLPQLYKIVAEWSQYPPEVSDFERWDFRQAIYDHVTRRWIRLQVPLQVTSPRANKLITLELRLFYGVDWSPMSQVYFREAFKQGDVVLYDGHSFLGSGPLDPSNYSPADFASKYQIFFFNSCSSFNYYGKDYFALKTNGSRNLDMVTNGLGAAAIGGGEVLAIFVSALFGERPHTWLQILEKSQYPLSNGELHDPNRVVDGEQDNTYDPIANPIQIGAATGVSVKLSTAACGGKASGMIQLAASANGADRVEFFVGSQKVGSDSEPPYAVSWDSTGVANGNVTVTARAYASDGTTAAESCPVTVDNSGSPTDLFFDDMEGATSWTATGLWHQVQSSSCASPGFASAVTAWYFGLASSCTYDTGSPVKGSLTSPAISGVTSSSTLSFKYLRGVESSTSGSYDRTSVEVSADGYGWTSIWTKDSMSASANAWMLSNELSLADFAEKTIRIRFTFDSVDSYANSHVGWMIDDVRVRP